MTVQLLLWSLFVLTESATRAASVKASFTPRFFIAEHSETSQHWTECGLEGNIPRYRRALILSATLSPSSY